MAGMLARAFLVLILLASPALADKFKPRVQRELGPVSEPTKLPDARTLTRRFPCNCPSEIASDKSRCGGRSAWCKLNGRSPECVGATKADCKRER